MRMIDLNTIEEWIEKNLQPQPATFIKKVLLAIEQEKGTVEAIPIEWLWEWERKYNENLEPWFQGETILGKVIEDWEKENDKDSE